MILDLEISYHDELVDYITIFVIVESEITIVGPRSGSCDL